LGGPALVWGGRRPVRLVVRPEAAAPWGSAGRRTDRALVQIIGPTPAAAYATLVPGRVATHAQAWDRAWARLP